MEKYWYLFHMLYTIATDTSYTFYTDVPARSYTCLHIHIQDQTLQYYYATVRARAFWIDILDGPNWWLSVVCIVFFAMPCEEDIVRY